jgi:hypothetical protein
MMRIYVERSRLSCTKRGNGLSPKVSRPNTGDRMNRQMLSLSFGLLAVALCASPAHAQRNAGAGFIPAGRPAGHPSGQMNGVPHRAPLSGRLVRARRGQRAFANSAYGPNIYPYYDSGFGNSYYDAAPTQFILETSAPAAPPAALAYPARPVESLVVELRGDHWVRLTSYGAQEHSANGNQEITSSPNPAAATVDTARTSPPVELPPAILVFRDGHTEQAANYTIVGKALTIKTDYWTTGAWTRTIPLAALDLPATLKLNHERGTKFSLPTRTGEVMMRP